MSRVKLRALLCSSGMTCLTFLSSPVGAQSPAADRQWPKLVEVKVPGCENPSLDERALMSLIEIELQNDGVKTAPFSASPQPASAMSRLTISATQCSGEMGEISIRIENLAQKAFVVRVLPIGDVEPPARPRVIALAAAELLRAGELGFVAVEHNADVRKIPFRCPSSTREVVHCREKPVPALQPKDSFIYAALLLDSRLYQAPGSPLLGGRIAGSVSLNEARTLRLRIDGGLHSGSTETALGSVSLGLVSGAVGLAFSTADARMPLEIGPRIEIGSAWTNGRSSRTNVQVGSGQAVIAVALLGATLRAPLSKKVTALVEVEAGTVLSSLKPRVEGTITQGVSGHTVGLRVGFATSLGQ